MRFASDAVGGRLVVDETVHVRVRILRDGGERVGEVKVSYDPAFESITSFEARTIAPDGKERRFGWNDGIDAPQFGGFAL